MTTKNNKLIYWILGILATICISLGGLVYSNVEKTNDEQTEKIEELYKQKADYEVIKDLMKLQEKQFDRIYEEIKDLREKETN